MPVADEAPHSSNGNGAMNGSSNGKSNRYLNHRPGSKLKVLSQGQGIFDDQRQIASVLGWPREQVDVELVQNGGAFGGKEDMSIQSTDVAGGRAVQQTDEVYAHREESFRLHPKRHAIRSHVKVACDAEGHITAIRYRAVGDKGAYASVVPKCWNGLRGMLAGPIACRHSISKSLAVYTNNPPCGAMRGFVRINQHLPSNN